ncbi:MAG: hypothetical protein ACP5XB_13995 [Isosphaeraceae bacterium]
MIHVLDDLGIRYMVTGSLASSIQGAPRLTHDIDLVVELPSVDSARLFQAFDPALYYLSRRAIDEAVSQGRMFNLLEYASGDKVDFWILTDEPFDQTRFGRRHTEEAFGLRINVSSPEDTILAKLRWALASGGSERQFGDAKSVYEVQGALLDLDYLRVWARRLGVEELWNRLQAEAEPL